MKINGALVFDTSSASEIQNLHLEKVSSLPTAAITDLGRMVFNTADNFIYVGYYTGAAYAWKQIASGGSAFSMTEGKAIETSLGAGISSTDGTFVAAGFTSMTGGLYTPPTSFTDAINQVAAQVTGHDALYELTDVTLSSGPLVPSGPKFLFHAAGAGNWVDHTLVLADVTDVTTTATELNQLHSQGAVAADFAKLHAITASAADVNLLSGAQAGTGTYSAGALTDTILSYLGGATPVTSNVQSQLNNKQPLNTGLTNWASFVNGSGTGIVVQTGPNAFADRTISSTDADLVVTNGDGVGGAPVLSLAGNLAALSALASTGFVVHTGSGAFVTDSLVSGSATRIVVTNGDGVAASPTIDLAAVTQGSTGSFLKFTVDGYGRVSSNTPVVTGDITALVDSQYIRLDGTTTPTASINFGGFAVQGVGTPVAGTDATNKNYVDAAIVGLEWKAAVAVASTGPATLATGFTAGTVIDGYTLVLGDRILIKNQTAPAENGIYVVTAGAPTRATDAATSAELNNATVFVTNGTAGSDTGWTQTTPNPVVGTSAVVFQQFTGSGTYTAGTGLLLTGNTFSAQLGAGIAELPTGEIGVDLYGVATSALILTDTGTARATTASSQLALLLAGSGGLTQDATGLYIPASGVSNAMLAHSSITLDVDGGGTGAISLGGTLSVLGTGAQGISTSIAGTVISITAADATTASKGVAQFDPASFTVTAGNVVISSAGVSNAQLAHSTIGYGGTTGGVQTVALGSSFNIVGGSSPITTVSAAGSVTINVASATTGALGLASFNGSQFSVTAGAASLNMTFGQGGITNVASAVDTAASGDLLSYNGSAWTNVTRATVMGTESIATLSDVASTTTSSAASGQALVYDAATSKWHNQSIYFVSAQSSSTTWTVSHNLGQKYCNVTVVDATDNVVIPQSIVFTDANTVTVTFNTAIAGTCVVMGVALL